MPRNSHTHHFFSRVFIFTDKLLVILSEYVTYVKWGLTAYLSRSHVEFGKLKNNF